MAVYKVPQDVEAEDKLLGPFTFRQFIYLIIAVASLAMAFFMFQVFAPLAIIPLPIALLFGTLALPLRKDQPMETYVLAIIRFYLKPKNRLWNPDGTITYVEITAPKLIEQRLSKDYTGEAAKERLDYLARVMDSRGWALKGLEEQDSQDNFVTQAVAIEAQSAVDVLDEDAAISRSFDDLIAKKDQERREEAIEHMQQMKSVIAGARQQTVWSGNAPAQAATRPTAPTSLPARPAAAPATIADEPTNLHFNPYPTSMHQKIVQPMGAAASTQAESPATATPTIVAPAQPALEPTAAVPAPVSPAIIRLADNHGLSISALAHEAHRLEGQLADDEVVINLH